jgi:hypothetical protein
MLHLDNPTSIYKHSKNPWRLRLVYVNSGNVLSVLDSLPRDPL